MERRRRAQIALTRSIGAQVREYLSVQGQRRKLFPRAMRVGLLAGGIAVAFRWALEGGDTLRDQLMAWAHHVPLWGWLLPLLEGALGAGLAVVLVHRVAPEAAGSGIPHIKAVLYWLRSMRWQAILLVKFVGEVVGICSGLALGREGPTVQLGGAVGAAMAQWLRASPRERQTLIAAGSGAGLAAAFNAPLAGLTFVLEELQGHFAPTVFGATFVAALTADVVTRLLTSQLPVFHVELPPPPPLTGIVLIVEMTNTYEQMVPLLVACLSAYAVADWVMDRPIYAALLERDLAQEAQAPDLHGPVILECTVQEWARFEGKQVHEIGLPEGCVLVALRRGLTELVPTAHTRLEAGDRLTAVIAPQATEALAMLREGCESPHTRDV